MKTLRSDGFAALEAILVVVVLVVLGGAGYEIVKIREHIKTPQQTATTTSNSSTSSTGNSSSATQSTGVTVPPAPKVTTSSDLNSALNTLNSVNLDAGSSDSSQLNSQAGAF